MPKQIKVSLNLIQDVVGTSHYKIVKLTNTTTLSLRDKTGKQVDYNVNDYITSEQAKTVCDWNNHEVTIVGDKD